MRTVSMLLESDYDFELAFVGGADDGDEGTPEYQRALIQAEQQLQALKVDLATGTSFAKAAGISSWLNGDFVIHVGEAAAFASIVTKPFVPVMTEWLRGRAGRKIRLKRGEIEVEARTIEEAEQAWRLISGDEQEPS